jgi:hypothetical protein
MMCHSRLGGGARGDTMYRERHAGSGFYSPKSGYHLTSPLLITAPHHHHCMCTRSPPRDTRQLGIPDHSLEFVIATNTTTPVGPKGHPPTSLCLSPLTGEGQYSCVHILSPMNERNAMERHMKSETPKPNLDCSDSSIWAFITTVGIYHQAMTTHMPSTEYCTDSQKQIHDGWSWYPEI